MPFTGSHPAAVLPFLGRGLPASALVIGSLVPDLPYYVSLPVSPTATHSWGGVVGIDLAFGIVLFLMWHLLLVPPLVWISPAQVQLRIPEQLRTSGRISTAHALGLVCLGLVMGGLTHVLLDSFTHADAWPVMRIEALRVPVAGLPRYRWLHLWLSALGLTLLALYLMRWWDRAPLVGAVETISMSVRWTIVVALLALSCFHGLWAAGWDGLLSPSGAMGTLIAGIVGFFSTFAVGLFVGAIVWHVALSPGRVRAPSS